MRSFTESAGSSGESDTDADSSITFRKPVKTDGHAIYRLVKECPPLDLNSVYSYLLLSEHFADTCVLAQDQCSLNGFVSAYIPPQKNNVLFVWQVAVHSRARGQGLGGRMLLDLLKRPGLEQIQYIETTISPDNVASRGMFSGLARRLNALSNESELFGRNLFGTQGHEAEPLIRIGPFGARPG